MGKNEYFNVVYVSLFMYEFLFSRVCAFWLFNNCAKICVYSNRLIIWVEV